MKKIIFLLLAMNLFANDKIWEEEDRFNLYKKDGVKIGTEFAKVEDNINREVSGVEVDLGKLNEKKTESREPAINYHFKFGNVELDEEGLNAMSYVGMGIELSWPSIENLYINSSLATGFANFTTEDRESIKNDYWGSYELYETSYNSFGIYIEGGLSIKPPVGFGKKGYTKPFLRTFGGYTFIVLDDTVDVPGLNNLLNYGIGAGLEFKSTWFIELGYEVFDNGSTGGYIKKEELDYTYFRFGFGGI